MKKICCSNESLCDYFFNRVLHSAFSGPIDEIFFLSILIHLTVLFREESKTQHQNGPDPQLPQESSQACMSCDQGWNIFQEKIFLMPQNQ